jgi:hypothetical protein
VGTEFPVDIDLIDRVEVIGGPGHPCIQCIFM